MKTDRAQLEGLFEAARSRATVTERQAYLDSACAGDSELRQQVESLLQAYTAAGDFLQSPAVPGMTGGLDRLDVSVRERAGMAIGQYRLLEQIGEGGMAVVFLAEQAHPIRREVALKIIKPGMDSRQVIARFEAERQALAIMDHQGIAKVLDAGTTDSGRPYFVMELVRGVALTRYCDEHRLAPNERLELFVQVCRAVQHAHSKGIIHRDIKPSNVLVGVYDGRPVPKVIDFGIAKAIGQPLTEQSLCTGLGSVVGTPEYMSPEQAELNPLDVDTRSDIYSLGVLLYELLTGTTPIEHQRIRHAALLEVLRVIREEEPPRPSVRLSTTELLPGIAASRGLEPRALRGTIKGDLDWIVMKALEKDRNRRYATAIGLARDLERYRDHEPVQARPPSAAYRFGKFARRNVAAIVTIATIALALLGGTVISVRQAVRAGQAEQLASQRLVGEQRAQREKTRLLGQSYIDQARALRSTARLGHRIDSLAAVRRATETFRSLGSFDEYALQLRNEAIAAMASPADLRVIWYKSFSNPAWWVAFDPDLSRYARRNNDGGGVVIAAAGDDTQMEAVELPGFGAPAGYLQFSPDGRYLVVQYQDGWCRLWDLAQRRAVVETQFVTSTQADVMPDFSADSQFLAVVGGERQVQVFETGSGRLATTLSLPRQPLQVRFHPRGDRFAILIGHDVEIWDLESCALAKTLAHPNLVYHMNWSADGSFLATSCENYRSYVWDLVSDEPRGAVPDGFGKLQFSGRGHLLATAGHTEQTVLWSVPGRQRLLSAPARLVQFAADDTRLGFCTSYGIGVWEVVSGGEYRQLTHLLGQNPHAFAFAPAPGVMIMVSSHKEGLSIWDTRTERLLQQVPIGEVGSVVLVPAWNAWVTHGRSGLWLWRLEQTPHSLKIGPPEPVPGLSDLAESLQLSGAGRLAAGKEWLAVANGLDTVAILNLAGSPQLHILKGHARVSSATVSPDGRWAATGTSHGEGLWLWDLRDGTHVNLWPASGHCAAAFSPDGQWLVATRGDEYRFWTTGDWTLRRTLPRDGHTDLPGPVTFTGDSRVVVVRTSALALKLLDLASGEELASLEAPQQVRSVATGLSPDGSLLADVAGHGVVGLWDIREIRNQLAQMHLDWDAGLIPSRTTREDAGPIHVEVDLGPLLHRGQTSGQVQGSE